MVAIKNDISKNFNFVNSTLNSEKSNELFAELFELMSSGDLNSEYKKLLKDVILQKTESEEYLDVNKNMSENNLFKVTPEGNYLEVTKSEYETAKSLVEVFYKEIGIIEPAIQMKKSPQKDFKQDHQLLLNKNFTTKENKLNSNEFDLGLKKENTKKITINIVNESSLHKKQKKNELNTIIFKEDQNQIDRKVAKQPTELNVKVKNPNLETVIINKKINKKKKQFKVSANEHIEHNEFHTKNAKIEHRKNTNFSLTNKKSGENQINQKREINNKSFSKTVDVKDNQMINKGQIFLDLLESSWGEKFSKIVRNAFNNGVNKLEIQVKPKNLGKLNLEVSVKNNITSINIGSENQDVVSLLNDNLPKLLESIDRESKSFSTNMNNENNNSNYFNERKDKKNFLSNNEVSEKNKKNVENKNQNLSIHNIDVNA